MRITEAQLRKTIRKLLREEVFGAQSFLYHGSSSPPEAFIPQLFRGEFNPGMGSGGMYGLGLYTVYDFEGSATSKGGYGRYVYKFKASLDGCIIFDMPIAKRVYGRELSPAQQAERLGLRDVARELEQLGIDREDDPWTSNYAMDASDFLKGRVKGMVFTSRKDGRCVVFYDVGVAALLSWRDLRDPSGQWHTVEDSEQPLVSRLLQAAQPFKPEKYEKPEVSDATRKQLGSLWNVPADQREFEGSLHLSNMRHRIKLPRGLRVKGSLWAQRSHGVALADDMTVEGGLYLTGTPISSLPRNLRVEDDLDLEETGVVQLPEDIYVGGTILPEELQVQYEEIVERRGGA